MQSTHCSNIFWIIFIRGKAYFTHTLYQTPLKNNDTVLDYQESFKKIKIDLSI